jgi:phospholipid/cholesterol/gamma-HCH transport system substrate-binding protein
MKDNRNHNLRLGILVIAGLSFFVASIYILGKQRNLFNKVIHIRSTFSDVKGLKTGNNVQFSGINIGTVTDIEIINDSTIMVEMSVKKEVRQFIRKDSRVEIENEGLMGNKVLTIYQGSPYSEPVEKNDILLSHKTLTTEDLLQQAKNIMEDAKVITENVAEITRKINTGDGDLSKLINEQTITSNLSLAGDQLVEASGKMNEITEKINNGKGDLGKMIQSTELTERMEEILAKLDSASESTNEIAYHLMMATKQINEGNGIVTKLLYDSVFAKRLDTLVYKTDTGIDGVVDAAETVDNSWLLNLFSKKTENK